jgi:hypothetical protein
VDPTRHSRNRIDPVLGGNALDQRRRKLAENNLAGPLRRKTAWNH